MFKIIILLCLCLCSPLPAFSKENPNQTIAAIQQAIDNKDMEAFSTLVDVNNLVSKLIQDFFTWADKNKQASASLDLPPALALIAASAADPKMRQSIQELLFNEISRFLKYGIESGHFSGKPDLNVVANGLLAPLLPSLSPGRKSLSFKSFDKNSLDAVLHDDYSNQDHKLKFGMKKNKNEWQITEILNVKDLLNALPIR